MDKHQLYFWIKAECELHTKYPDHIKNSFHLYGYYDEITFDGLDDEDINYIETQNKTKTLQKISGKAEPIWFLGPFFSEHPEHFEISRGERKQIKQLVGLISNKKSQKDFFKMNKFKLDYNQVIFSSTIGGYYFGKPNQLAVQNTTNEKDDTNSNIDLVTSLKFTLKSSLLKLNLTDDEIDSSLTNIKVDKNGNLPEGFVECGWCAHNDKRNTIKLASKQNVGRKGTLIYWVPSNFIAHFKRVHIQSKNANVAKLKPAQPLQVKNTNSHDKNTSGTDKPAHPSNMENKENVNEVSDVLFEQHSLNEDGKQCILQEDSVGNVSTDRVMTDVDLDAIEKRIFKQISDQLAQVANSVQISGMIEEELTFLVENNDKIAKVLKCKPNGSCLFQAMTHQLHLDEFNSKKQTDAVKKLQKEVVAHIKEDVDAYKHQLNNTIYEGMSKEKLAEMANLDKMDLNKQLASQREEFVNKMLPKLTTWGGSESMLAVSKLYRVNILVVCELDSFYYNNFSLEHDRSICIAYRSAKNHYDTITSIPQEDIFNIAKTLANRIYSDMKCDIMDIEEFDVEEEGFEVCEE